MAYTVCCTLQLGTRRPAGWLLIYVGFCGRPAGVCALRLDGSIYRVWFAYAGKCKWREKISSYVGHRIWVWCTISVVASNIWGSHLYEFISRRLLAIQSVILAPFTVCAIAQALPTLAPLWPTPIRQFFLYRW